MDDARDGIWGGPTGPTSMPYTATMLSPPPAAKTAAEVVPSQTVTRRGCALSQQKRARQRQQGGYQQTQGDLPEASCRSCGANSRDVTGPTRCSEQQ